jgi:thioredoxin 1
MSFINNLSKKEFDEAVKGTKTFLFLDFYADWCGPCIRMMPIIDKMAQDEDLLGKVSFHKINADFEEELSVEFGVKGIPAFFLVESNEKEKYEIVKSWVGTQDPFKLKADILMSITAEKSTEVLA